MLGLHASARGRVLVIDVRQVLGSATQRKIVRHKRRNNGGGPLNPLVGQVRGNKTELTFERSN